MNEQSFQMLWVTKIIYDSYKKIEKTDSLINTPITPPAYSLLLLLIIYNQCYMMINKFVNDFIKLLKHENLFIKRIIVFQMKRHFDFKHSWKFRRNIYIRFSNQSNESVKLKFVLYSHSYFTDFFLNPPGCWVSQKSSGKKKEKRKEERETWIILLVENNFYIYISLRQQKSSLHNFCDYK